MNIQEVLENYNTYKFRISVAEAKIQELEDEVIDIKGTRLDGMPKSTGYVESNVEAAVIEKHNKIEEKEREIKRIKLELKVVEDLVRTLKKYNQDVIEMRYYQKMSIEEIAARKGKEYGAVQKTIERSIEKMQKEYDKYHKMS